MEKRLDSALQNSITGHAKCVVIGLNWTYVEGPVGAGIVHTPARGTEGCRSLPEPGNYQGRALADIARLTASKNIFERVLGFAAINANHNRFDLKGASVNGLDIIHPRSEHTVIIGRFPRLDKRLPGAAVIERNPYPGEYPMEAAADLLPAADFIAITASTVSNGTLSKILTLTPKTAFTVLVGPSAPLSPVLFDLGIDALSGLVPHDLNATAQCIAEGGTVSALKAFGRYVTIFR